jgi:hypothetical protein
VNQYKSVGEIFKGKEHLLTPEMLEVITLLNEKLKLADAYRRKWVNLTDTIYAAFFESDVFLLEGRSKEDALKRIMAHCEEVDG